ncbi:TPA: outer membrane protein OmpW, partial [Escherichia coli O25b:H4-ST131]
WYMDIDTEVKYKSNGAVLPAGRYSDNVRLDPWVFMFSAGYRF